jgi:hypothetical protein
LHGERLTGVFGVLGNQAFRDSLGPGAANLAPPMSVRFRAGYPKRKPPLGCRNRRHPFVVPGE